MKGSGIRAVEMTRRIRDMHCMELNGKTPRERIDFYREKAKALHAELGRTIELPNAPTLHRTLHSSRP